MGAGNIFSRYSWKKLLFEEGSKYDFSVHSEFGLKLKEFLTYINFPDYHSHPVYLQKS